MFSAKKRGKCALSAAFETDQKNFKTVKKKYLTPLSLIHILPTVFNAANERAVALFLAKKIRFLEIYDVIAGAMEAHKTIADPTLEQILAAEQETYEWIANRYKMGE